MNLLANYVLPNPAKTLEEQLELVLLAMVVWGESRGEPMEGKRAVAHVIMNRWRSGRKFGKTVRDVILKPAQFSSLNPDDPNRKKMMTPPANETWQQCFWAAYEAYFGTDEDPTGGATHFTRVGYPATWKKYMIHLRQIGHHDFFKSK